jgi:hypothetical protein
MADPELDELIKTCINNPEHIHSLNDDQVENITKKITLYGSLTHTPSLDFSCCSITNLRETYIKRLLMVSIVGYIFRALDEYNGVSDKTLIKNFLNSIFDFNPDFHVKKSNEKKKNASDIIPDYPNHLLNIPADTFYRIDKYMDVNYEFMRSIVEHVYCEKPDFDYIINIYDAFPTETDATTFIKKYQDQFIHDVHTIKNNHWTFLGPFKQNRDKIDFYNDNTEQLQAILEQVESDQKLGKELMKKRVTNEKRANIRRQGKHADDIGDAMGNKETTADDADANDMSRDDDPYLRVDVFETDGIDIKKSHFLTESVKPTEIKKI